MRAVSRSKYCFASTTCSGYGVCDSNGNCVCNQYYTGTACNQCVANHYGSSCLACPGGDVTPCTGHGTHHRCVVSGLILNACLQARARAVSVATASARAPAAGLEARASIRAPRPATVSYQSLAPWASSMTCAARRPRHGPVGRQLRVQHGLRPAVVQLLRTPVFLGSVGCLLAECAARCSPQNTDYYSYPTCTYCLAGTTCSGHGMRSLSSLLFAVSHCDLKMVTQRQARARLRARAAAPPASRPPRAAPA